MRRTKKYLRIAKILTSGRQDRAEAGIAQVTIRELKIKIGRLEGKIKELEKESRGREVEAIHQATDEFLVKIKGGIMEKIREGITEEITECREENDREYETAGRRVSALKNKEHEEEEEA